MARAPAKINFFMVSSVVKTVITNQSGNGGFLSDFGNCQFHTSLRSIGRIAGLAAFSKPVRAAQFYCPIAHDVPHLGKPWRQDRVPTPGGFARLLIIALADVRSLGAFHPSIVLKLSQEDRSRAVCCPQRRLMPSRPLSELSDRHRMADRRHRVFPQSD